MKTALIFSLVLLGLLGGSYGNRAKQLISLIADVVKTSPPTNRFMVMIETNELDYFMAGMIEQFASVWSGEFITAGGDCVAKDPTTIPLGKRSALEVHEIEKREDISASSLLNILDSPEGQAIIKKGASGGTLSVPAPKFASGGVTMGSLPVAGHPSGGLRGKRETAAAALLRKVRNIVVNKPARSMFVAALDDYTTRVALYNVCNCDSFANFIEWYSKLVS